MQGLKGRLKMNANTIANWYKTIQSDGEHNLFVRIFLGGKKYRKEAVMVLYYTARRMKMNKELCYKTIANVLNISRTTVTHIINNARKMF